MANKSKSISKTKPYRKLAASTRKSWRSDHLGDAAAKGLEEMVNAVGWRKTVNDIAKKPTSEIKTGWRDLDKTTRLHEFGVGNSSRPIAGFKKKNG
jgi:hypothetical protein